ncbi:hypothetical protein L9F63_006905, partial [Diploptera punctata]
IVRNKAAEKAKHVHHQQQQQQSGGSAGGNSQHQQQQQQQTGSVSVITHAPASSVPAPPHHPGGHHDPQRPGAYSINGILGIPQPQQPDPNGNSITKRKRDEHHADENRDLNGHPEDEIKRQRTQYNGDQLYSNLWSSKWSIKDEHKLLSELGSGAANGGSPYYDAQTGFPTVTTTSDLYESISTMTQAQSAPVYTPPIGTSLGPGTLTPLAPITLQEMKLDPTMAAYQQESSTYNGVNTSTDAAAAGSSPGLPLSLPADPAPPAAPGGNSSPDPGSLTVLQPANNNTATAAAASPYSTMLPG